MARAMLLLFLSRASVSSSFSAARSIRCVRGAALSAPRAAPRLSASAPPGKVGSDNVPDGAAATPETLLRQYFDAGHKNPATLRKGGKKALEGFDNTRAQRRKRAKGRATTTVRPAAAASNGATEAAKQGRSRRENRWVEMEYPRVF